MTPTRLRPLAFLCVWFGLSTVAFGQFAPTLTTSFDTLDAGVPAVITQEYGFFTDEAPPNTILVEFDAGTLDLSTVAVDDVIGTLTVDLVIDNPIPFLPDIEGQVLGEAVATSVEDDPVDSDGLLTADVSIISIDDVLLDVLLLLGGTDPTGALAFSVSFVDITAGGVSLEAVDTGGLPLDDILLFDVPIVFEFDPIYVHSVTGGELAITTTITSSMDEDAEIDELFALVGGESGFRRGDVDGNGVTAAILDALFLLEWGFTGGAAPPCQAAADADGNGTTAAILDALYLLEWGFTGGDAPPDPGPTDCGPDPDPDGLECTTLPDCL